MVHRLYTTVINGSLGGMRRSVVKIIEYDRGCTGKPAKVQYGTASYYHDKFHGRRTANGEIFSQDKMTCAHNTLPLGTWIRVTNLRNKRTVIVRVTDRLHPRNPRLVDLSKKAAKKLNYVGYGLTKVKVEVLSKNDPEVALAASN